MSLTDLPSWIEENIAPNVVWYAKRLSGNDTLANGTHQAGPYVPKELLFDLFPVLNQPAVVNPDVWFQVYIDSHCEARKVRAVWYNNKLRGRTRNEARITNFGGAESILLNPESTGALAVFAFHKIASGNMESCHIWLCDNEIEEDLVEDLIGPVDPGCPVVWTSGKLANAEIKSLQTNRTSCWLDIDDIPENWLKRFPSCEEIIRKTVEMQGGKQLPVDARILKRRECEYEIFRSIEQAVELPFIKPGFDNIDDFVAKAQSMLQRRKSRAGRSLELQAREVFLEEGFTKGLDFDHQPETENSKRPDFLFPSEAAYKNPDFPAERLRMLAVKTTCKDRWRQVLDEAARIPNKHILTLQEGVSEAQFSQMMQSNVTLVVPTQLVTSFPPSVRPHLQSLESFMADMRLLNLRER